MVFDYFAFARAKKNQEELEKSNPQNPVLKQQDEEFLTKVATHDVPDAPLPPAPIDDKISPEQTEETKDAVAAAGSTALPKQTDAETTSLSASATLPKRTWASYVPSVPSVPALPSMPNVSIPSVQIPSVQIPSVGVPSMPSLPTWRTKTPQVAAAAPSEQHADEKTDASAPKGTAESQTAEEELAVPPGVKVTENVQLDQAKKEQDEKEVSVLLDRLKFSSINNRVFSFSAQSQKIYEDFLVVLKDMINGAPTAYEDMEKLLKDNDHYLRETFYSMPPFVQTLVKALPARLGGSLGPEIMAAASEKPGADLKTKMKAASSPDQKKTKKDVPSVKGLASEKGAVTGMLRSTVTFLQNRFPAFVTGTNVIMSLAVFILLFVFWYCHKRGKETRIQKEHDASSITEGSDAESGLEESLVLDEDGTESKEGLEEQGEENEEETGGAETGQAETVAEDTSEDPVGAGQALLDQPEPAEVPLPSKA